MSTPNTSSSPQSAGSSVPPVATFNDLVDGFPLADEEILHMPANAQQREPERVLIPHAITPARSRSDAIGYYVRVLSFPVVSCPDDRPTVNPTSREVKYTLPQFRRLASQGSRITRRDFDVRPDALPAHKARERARA